MASCCLWDQTQLLCTACLPCEDPVTHLEDLVSVTCFTCRGWWKLYILWDPRAVLSLIKTRDDDLFFNISLPDCELPGDRDQTDFIFIFHSMKLCAYWSYSICSWRSTQLLAQGRISSSDFKRSLFCWILFSFELHCDKEGQYTFTTLLS